MGHLPFTLPESIVIFNRTTGSTTLPDAVPAESLIPVATAPSTKHDVTVALGVGIPLLTAALVALGMFCRERRLRLKLTNGPGSGLQHPTTVLVSMGTNKVYEFEGTPVVKELAASYIGELGKNPFEVI